MPQNANGALPASSSSTIAHAPPAACSAASVGALAHDRVGVDRAAAGLGRRADRIDVVPRDGPRSRRARSASGASRRSSPSQPRASSSRSIAGIRALFSGCEPGVVLERARVVEVERRTDPGTVIRPSWRSRAASPSEPTSPWSAPAPPASTRRSRPRARARASCSCRARRSRSRRATGRRAASRPRSPAEDSPDRHLADTLAAGRGTTRESAARVLCREAPARVRDLESLGVRFDADRHGALALGPRGRTLGAARRPRRRQRDGPAHHARAVGDRRRSTSGSRCSSTRPPASIWTLDGRCIGVRADQPESGSRAVVARATLLATGGAAALWERTTNPRGAIGAGMTLAHAAGAALADMEMIQFHPTALASGGRARRLPDHRGGPRRGRAALRRLRRAIRGRARAARRGGARGQAQARRGRPRRARHDDGAARPVPERREHAQRGRHRPLPRARACRAGGPLHDGRDRDRPRRRLVAAPGCTRSASARATGCTARTGWRRTRSPSASCSAAARRWPGWPSRSRRATRASRPPRGRTPCRRARRARRCGGWPESSARPRELRELLDDPFPLARIIAASALAREESRGAHQRSDFPETDARFDRMHAVARGDGVPRFERWD